MPHQPVFGFLKPHTTEIARFLLTTLQRFPLQSGKQILSHSASLIHLPFRAHQDDPFRHGPAG